MPQIAIIVPVYNVAKYLSQCLESLILQTFSDLEIICINDGSTDESGEILMEYAKRDSRIHVIHQRNTGVSAARNTGLNIAVASHVMFCDGDDWYEANCCERMYETLQKEKCDMVVCSVLRNGDGIKRHKMLNVPPVPPGKYNKIDDIFFTLDGAIYNKIFKRELLQKYEIMFPPIIIQEDAVFLRKYLFILSSFYVLDEFLYHYRIRDGSCMGTWNTSDWAQKHYDYVHSFSFLYYFIQKHGLWERYKKLYIFDYILFLRYIWYHYGNKNPERFFETIRPFLLENGITNWGNRRNNRLIESICKRRYTEASRRMTLWLYTNPKVWLRYFRIAFFRLFLAKRAPSTT